MTDNRLKQLECRVARGISEAAPAEAFDDLLLEIAEFQRAAQPAYDHYCATQPPIRHWSAIPALPQQVFKDHAIRSFPVSATTHTFRTSGTTGEGFGEHHFPNLHLYELAARHGWQHAGLAGLDVLSLIPPPSDQPHSSLSHMAGWLTDYPNFFASSAGGRWDELTEALSRRESPVLLFGTALAFLDWFDFLGTRTIPLPPGSLAVETGGYKGSTRSLSKAELYDRFERHLGLPPTSVINEYGMTELSSQFYSRGLDQPHAAPPWARALVIDPETNAEVPDGGTGVLRLFDAANLYSLCAIQTRDLAIRRGSAFQLLGRDPAALPRGCSRAADELLTSQKN